MMDWAAGQSYVSSGNITFGADTSDIERVFYRLNGTDIPIDNITLTDYADISDKTVQDYPNSLVVDDALLPVAYLWPIPDNDLSIVIHAIRIRLTTDILNSLSSPDFPKDAQIALMWALVDELGPEYVVPLNEQIRNQQKAEILKRRLKAASSLTDTDTFIRSAFERR